MKLKAIWFAVLCATVFFPGMPSRAENPVKASPDKFSLAVECVKRFEGWHEKKSIGLISGGVTKFFPGRSLPTVLQKHRVIPF